MQDERTVSKHNDINNNLLFIYISIFRSGRYGASKDRGHPRPVRGRDPPHSGGRGQAQPEVFESTIPSGTIAKINKKRATEPISRSFEDSSLTLRIISYIY